MRHALTSTAVVIAGALALTACGSSGQSGGDSQDKKLVVGVTNQGESVTFPAAIGRGIKDEADKLGVELIETDAQFKPAKQANDVQDLLAQQPDGILMIPVNAANSASLVDKISAAGIPVASVHGVVGADRKPKDVYPKLSFLYNEDEVAAGQQAGQMAVEALPEGGKVAIIEGQAGFAEVALRAQDFKSELKKAKNFQIVANQPGDWTLQKGRAACQNILTSQPDIALFYAESDDMAVGCTKAIESAKSNAKVIGIGGAKTGIDAIKAGKMYGTVCYKPYTAGREAMAKFYEQLTGKKDYKADFITYPAPAITKANVDDCKPQW